MGLLDFLRFHPAPVPLREPVAARKALSDAAVPVSRDWTYNWGWQDAEGGVGLVGGYSASYAEMYRRQVWVYAVVNALKDGIASLPLKVYRRAGDDRERERASPLATLLAFPYPRETEYALREQIVGDLAIYGNAIVVKVGARRGTPPTALRALCPRHFAIDRDGDYLYRDPQGGEKGFPQEQIIHFRYWQPGADALGMSPLEPLRYTLAIEDAAQRLGIAAFKNGGNRPGLLSTDQLMTADDQQRLSAAYSARHSGVDNAYKTPVLFGGLKWQGTGGTMEESAVVEHRRLTRDEVCANYHMPPPHVGILDRATFSNIEVQNRMLAQHTYPKYTGLIEQTFAAQLIPDFGDPAELYAEHDYNSLLRGTPEQRFTAYAQAINAGIFTQNEVRRMENYPPSSEPDAEMLHRPLNLFPAPEAPAPAAQEGGTPNAGA
jgi:HK97 family phage portal protein